MVESSSIPHPVTAAVADAVDSLRLGGMVIIVDDQSRCNEGDLVLAADMVTPEAVNRMTKIAGGLVCVAMTHDMVDRIGIPMMASNSSAHFGSAFTVSVDSRLGTTTGISAFDRARTIEDLCAEDASMQDFVVPGHVFPLRAESGGVLKRAGHTEGGCDIARLAGFAPAAVLADVLDEDGNLATGARLRDFAARGLPKPGRQATATHLWEFIVAELNDCALPDFAPLLRQEWMNKGGLLLLDGLDEVPEANQRRTLIKAAVEDFARAFSRGRILVTSPTYA